MGHPALTLSLIHLLGFLALALTSPYFARINHFVRSIVGRRRNIRYLSLMVVTHKYGDLISMSVQVIVLAVLFGWIWQDWLRALLLTAAMFFQIIIVSITKKMTARARPPENKGPVSMSSGSFPSGHTAASMTFALLVPLLLAPYLPPVFIYIVSGYLFTAALLTAYGRLYLDVHWLTDIIGGWLLAGAILHFCRLFLG